MMLREIKPRNARSARALAKREPVAHESSKRALFLKSTTTSSLVNEAARDLQALRRALTVRFTRRNAIHPFEDASSLEFFSQKNDASLLCLSSHSKKRPHRMVFARTHAGSLFDMLECTIAADTARSMRQFAASESSRSVRAGLKPLLTFSGLPFAGADAGADPDGTFALAKSIFTDFFKGEDVTQLDVEGLQCLISFAAAEQTVPGAAPLKTVHMRVWRLVTKRSGQKVPRVELEEIGPRLDFHLGRARFPEPAILKEAMKQAKGLVARPKKNIETDAMGDKTGRIHVGRQDLNDLQTRKMKGLKRGRDDEDEDEDQDVEEEGSDFSDIEMADAVALESNSEESAPVTPKRQRTEAMA